MKEYSWKEFQRRNTDKDFALTLGLVELFHPEVKHGVWSGEGSMAFFRIGSDKWWWDEGHYGKSVKALTEWFLTLDALPVRP